MVKSLLEFYPNKNGFCELVGSCQVLKYVNNEIFVHHDIQK